MVEEQTATRKKTRRERFMHVATRRTRQLLKDIRRLANCSNRSAYEYEEADVTKIFSAIESEVAAARARFDKKAQRKEVEFSLE